MRFFFLLLSLLCYLTCFSQPVEEGLEKDRPRNTYYANTLSVHPLGIFLSRINNNFQLTPDKEISIDINVSNGNVWLPYVKGYKPLNQADRNAMSELVWSSREFKFDTARPADKLEFAADGIIRRYQLHLNIPIRNTHEIKMRLNTYSLDPGEIPYSFLTSDQVIEWFHSNVIGGEDPFARKHYGFNKAKIMYKDPHGNTLTLDNGEFVFSNIDLSYYYYPQLDFLKKRNLFATVGAKSGFNINKASSSIDLGGNFTLLKNFKLKNPEKEIRVGLSMGALRQRFIRFKESVELSNKKYLLHAEMLFEYVKFINDNSYLSWATTWFLQDSYNKKIDYFVLSGNRVSSHWHYALSHLNRPLSGNNFVFTYGKGSIAIWLYLREDGWVDNAPDVQTGIGLKWFITKLNALDS